MCGRDPRRSRPALREGTAHPPELCVAGGRCGATGAGVFSYGRVEAFAGFINTLALAYAALNIFYEAVARLLDPPSVKTDDLLTVSFLGLLVNLLGIFAFEHGGHGHSHGGGGGGHSHAHGAHDGECEDEGTAAAASVAAPTRVR